MFKRIKLLKRQSQGLLMVRDGMQIQIDFLRTRSETTEYESQLQLLNYWKREIDKALNGDLHF